MVDFDYVIVAAGAAGRVLASRLSEDPGNQVLLLECEGRDTNPLLYVPEGLCFTSRAGSRAKGLTLPGIAAFVAATRELVSDEQGTLAGQEEGDR